MTLPPRSSPITVLLVEDNIAIRTLQRYVLTRAGLTVVECADLPDAKNYLRTQTPEVVVLDLNLPGGHGLNLLPQINRRRTAVLVMTAMCQQHTLNASEDLRDDFMTKPFAPDTFVLRVQNLARQRQA
ncbi:response regulator [Deinococcus saxicola]|uniref:response regulator transcription factor n=1 Tax=Deinococcus saxicola TaxID=249406 RepID=UPI0039F013F4